VYALRLSGMRRHASTLNMRAEALGSRPRAKLPAFERFVRDTNSVKVEVVFFRFGEEEKMRPGFCKPGTLNDLLGLKNK